VEAQAVLTIGAVDTGVLVVTEEKATVALTLIAAHGIDTNLLAATIVVLTLIHICKNRKREGEEKSHLELAEERYNPFVQAALEGLHRGTHGAVLQWHSEEVLLYGGCPVTLHGGTRECTREHAQCHAMEVWSTVVFHGHTPWWNSTEVLPGDLPQWSSPQ
jgi:hypothetical protein